MANTLQLRVLLNTIDKATGPLKRIMGGSQATARALKAARDQAQQLSQQQRDIRGYRIAQIEAVKQARAIADLTRKTNDQTAQLNQQRTAHQNLKANLSAARTQYNKLSKALIENKGSSAEFMRELEKAQIKLQSTQQAYTRSATSMKTYQDRVRANTRQLNQLAQQHSNTQKTLGQYTAKLTESGIGVDNLSGKVRNLRSQQAQLNSTLEKQKLRLQALNKANQDYQRGQQMAGNMVSKGAGAMATGSVALYGGAKMLLPGLEFDASMSNVQAVTRLEKDSDDFKGLREQARELGGSTQYTAGQAADAQAFLGMAGFNPKAIKETMPGMLDLASAGGTELAETADIASNIMSGMGLKAKEMGRLGDVLTGTFNRANTNLQMLGETMKYAAPMAKTYGVDLETAAAMAGKLADNGVQASMAGTSLSTIMNRLAAPPKAAKKALDKLNIKTADANGNLRDLPDILKEIHDKTRGMGNAVSGGLFKAIAGEEAVKGLIPLVNLAGNGELQELVTALRASKGEAATAAKVKMDHLRGDLKSMTSAWEDLGIELQDQQNGTLRGLTQSLTEVIRDVKNWARENPTLAASLVKAAAVVAALTAGFGALALTLAGIFGPFLVLRLMLAQVGIRLPSLIGLFWNLGKNALPFVTKAIVLLGRALMMNPIGLAITAIGTAAFVIYQYWDKIVPYFQGLWAEITAGFNGGIGSIIATLVNFSPLGLFYKAFASVMDYFGIELPTKFTEFGAMIIDGLLSGITEKYNLVKDKIGEIGDNLTGWFKEKLSIHSPSRVFAELGGFTMAGLTQGLEDGESGPLNAVATQRENLLALKQLRSAFEKAPVDAVTPQVIAQYRDKRSAKVRANRELSLLSHIYNIAREWGVTEKQNPVTGVRKNKETPRDFYAGPLIWDAVYAFACFDLRDAMDLAYLTGQRPSDVLKVRASDVVDGFLQVGQLKTSKKLRIRLKIGDQVTQLGLLIERLLEQRRQRHIRGPYLIVTESGLRVSSPMLRRRFDDARQKAAEQAMADRDSELAESIKQFQFRDIRPKAASEIDDLADASRLLGHTDKRITETVYRRVGEIVKPTR